MTSLLKQVEKTSNELGGSCSIEDVTRFARDILADLQRAGANTTPLCQMLSGK